jgi:hypothetical protein
MGEPHARHAATCIVADDETGELASVTILETFG